MESEKSNLLKMMLSAVSIALIFLVACAFVFVYLPEDGAVVALESPKATEQVVEVAKAGETVEQPVSESVVAEEISFMTEFGDEIDVGGDMLFDNDAKIGVKDTTLILYSNPQSRIAVEWFYSQVTNDRDTAIAILDAAAKFNISPALAFALAHTESCFKANAKHTNVNGSVDRGLFQLNNYSFPKLTEKDFYDPATSAYYGMSHLSFCLDTAGNEIAGLAMYNAGRNKVQNNKTPQVTLNYISQIESYKQSLEEKFASEVLAFYSSGNGTTGEQYLAKLF